MMASTRKNWVLGLILLHMIGCGGDRESLTGSVNPDFRSHLPLVVVEIAQPVKRGKKYMGEIKIYDRASNHVLEDKPTLTQRMEIKVRGHSSAGFAKKQFSIELKDEEGEDTKASLLGMPEHEDWILHAPYSDKSLMRNHLAYSLWEKMGHYAVRRKYIEVFFREGNRSLDYRGVYLLWEKISKGDERLDVGKASKKREKDSKDVGGFIISKDKVDADDFYFVGKDRNLIQVEYPNDKKILPAQVANIKMYYDAFTGAVSHGKLDRVEKLADVDSFVDHALLKDFSSDVDAYWASTYFHRPKDGRLTAGPVWDFNIAFGNHSEWLSPTRPVRHLNFWKPLLKIPEVTKRYRQRWQELRQTVFSDAEMEGFVDLTAAQLGEARERNFQRWKVLGRRVLFNLPYNPKYYEGELVLLKRWLRTRAAYFDKVLEK